MKDNYVTNLIYFGKIASRDHNGNIFTSESTLLFRTSATTYNDLRSYDKLQLHDIKKDTDYDYGVSNVVSISDFDPKLKGKDFVSKRKVNLLFLKYSMFGAKQDTNEETKNRIK